MRAAAAWARAEVRGRWRGLLAVSLLIGVLAAVAMTAIAGARRTETSYDRFRQATLAHDVSVFIDSGDAARLDQVAGLDSVAAAAVGNLYPAFVDLDSAFDIGIIAFPTPDFGTGLDRGRYLAGGPPGADRADEVAVNERAADQLDARVGDVVELETFSPEQIATLSEGFSGRLEGPLLRLHVTGIVRHAADLESDQANVLLFASEAFDRAHGDDVGRFASVAIYRLNDGQAGEPGFLREARPLLQTDGELSISTAGDTGGVVREALDILSAGLLLIGVAAAVVAAVAGGQALARQLGQSAADHGVLAALGLTPLERAGAVALVTLPVAVLAGVVAGVGSILASPLTPISLGRTAEPDPGLTVDALVHGAGVAVVAVVVLAAGSVVGLVLAARALTVAPPPRRPSLGTRVAGLLHLAAPAGAGVRMALEPGAGRSRVPVRSAITGTVVALAGLVGALTFGASLDRLVSTPARFGSPWDLQPDLFEDEELPAWIVERDAEAVGLLTLSSVAVEGRAASGYAIEPLAGSPQFEYLEGRPPADSGEVALGRDLLDRVDRDVGDTVMVATAEGGERRFRVVGAALSPSIDDDPIGGAAFFTPAGLEVVAQSEISGVQSLIWWRDGVDQQQAQARFREEFPENFSVYAIPQKPAEIINLERAGTLPRVFAGFMALVGAAALVHALAVSTRRRRKDLAVLRSLGFLRRQVASALAWQASTIAVVGLIVGIPLGLAVGRWAWILVADGVGVASDPLVPLLGMGLVIPGAVAVVNLLGAPLGARAARRPPAAALRAE